MRHRGEVGVEVGVESERGGKCEVKEVWGKVKVRDPEWSRVKDRSEVGLNRSGTRNIGRSRMARGEGVEERWTQMRLRQRSLSCVWGDSGSFFDEDGDEG
jgi:hypothetical protein